MQKESNHSATPSHERSVRRKEYLWKWKRGFVDPRGEHIEIRCGDAKNSDYDSWHPIALVGKPENQERSR